MMTIALARDIAIIVIGAVTVIVLVIVAVVALSLYGQIRKILRSARATSAAVERFVSYFADEEAITRVVAIFQGVRQSVRGFTQFFRGGGNKDE